jgi:predicted amidohydrolase
MQLEDNFNKAANFVRSAAAQGAELAVLPEYHLTNWLPKDPGFVGLCDQWEVYLRKYRDLAKECGICELIFQYDTSILMCINLECDQLI